MATDSFVQDIGGKRRSCKASLCAYAMFAGGKPSHEHETSSERYDDDDDDDDDNNDESDGRVGGIRTHAPSNARSVSMICALTNNRSKPCWSSSHMRIKPLAMPQKPSATATGFTAALSSPFEQRLQ